MASADNMHVSISAIKASFLQTQTRLLCAPLHLSPTYRSWLRNNDTNHGLSDKQLANLQKRVNDKISQHSKAVFSSQSISHVAEQIETLYWNQLTDEEGVEELPETLADALLRDHRDREEVEEKEEARRYAQLRGRLVALAKKRGAEAKNSAESGDSKGRDEKRAGAHESVVIACECEAAANAERRA
ncbi:hypothetical protein DV736_g2155, partial [Chaetothyriales sp. CBS 134916]